MVSVSFLAADAQPPAFPSHTIAPNYVGWSMEMPCESLPDGSPNPSPLLTLNGNSNPALITLVNNLANASMTTEFPYYVRIGGNSQDELWFPGTTGLSVSPPTNGNCVVKSVDMKVMSDFYSALSVPVSVTVGVSMSPQSAADRTALAVQFLNGAVIPNWSKSQLAGVELGNEPQQWPGAGFRDSSWDPVTGFASEWSQLQQGIAAAIPNPSFQFVGPSTSVWTNGLAIATPFLLSNPPINPNLVTLHFYSGSVSEPANPTPEYLLSVNNYPDYFAYFIQSQNLPPTPAYKFILSEDNSISSGGNMGVTNVYASALWAVDHLCMTSWSGFSGVWFHGGIQGNSTFAPVNGVPVAQIGTYGPVVVDSADPTQINVRPEFYGQLAFTRAVRWIATAGISVTRGQDDDSGLSKYFSFYDASKPTRATAILINKTPSASMVDFQLPDGCTATTAVVEVMQQANGDISAVVGISVAGQTWDGTKDGNPLGAYTAQSIVSSNGTFSVTVPPYAVAVVFAGTAPAGFVVMTTGNNGGGNNGTPGASHSGSSKISGLIVAILSMLLAFV